MTTTQTWLAAALFLVYLCYRLVVWSFKADEDDKKRERLTKQVADLQSLVDDQAELLELICLAVRDSQAVDPSAAQVTDLILDFKRKQLS